MDEEQFLTQDLIDAGCTLQGDGIVYHIVLPDGMTTNTFRASSERERFNQREVARHHLKRIDYLRQMGFVMNPQDKPATWTKGELHFIDTLSAYNWCLIG